MSKITKSPLLPNLYWGVCIFVLYLEFFRFLHENIKASFCLFQSEISSSLRQSIDASLSNPSLSSIFIALSSEVNHPKLSKETLGRRIETIFLSNAQAAPISLRHTSLRR